MAKKSNVALAIIVGAILLPADAWAYLDPGTASILLQGILAGIAAMIVVLKLYWHKLLKFFGLRKTKIEGDDSPNDSSSPDNSNTK